WRSLTIRFNDHGGTLALCRIAWGQLMGGIKERHWTSFKRFSMTRTMCSVLVVAFGLTGLATAADQQDLATATLATFRAKCAGCHGPDLSKPKGRFGYVLDLARVRSNREMVVPGAPEESELWDLVNRGEMPPPDSPTGPLSATQKDVIRAWIAE